ncbi:MAG: DUF92 domain-containing protein [Gemmatimonadaceae bacterium]
MVERVAAGLPAAAAIAWAARRAGSLSTSGAVAATAVGTAAVAAGWRWAALLVIYFISSSLLSRVGAAEKARRTSGVVAKGGARDAIQVLANGGLFAFFAAQVPFVGAPLDAWVAAAALGALAAATADTWATEVGTLIGGAPRTLLTLRRAPPGTSGAVSVAGTLAMIAGALFIALLARALSLTTAVGIVASAGAAGAMADSLLGATLQERRWCDACALATERRVHACGTVTRLVGGRAWMDNDVVNFIATLVGAVVATALVAV